MSQRDKIKEILSDGQRHCSIEFLETLYCVDYRKRLSEIKQEAKEFDLKSEPCRGRCGRSHKANMHWYWISRPEQANLFL